MRSIARWTESYRPKGLQVLPRTLQRQRTGSRRDGETRTQLDKRPALPQVEGATSKSGDRNQKSKVVASADGAQPRTPADSGGNMGTAPRRATNVDDRRRLCTDSESIRNGFF